MGETTIAGHTRGRIPEIGRTIDVWRRRTSAENRILRAQIQGKLLLSDAEKARQRRPTGWDGKPRKEWRRAAFKNGGGISHPPISRLEPGLADSSSIISDALKVRGQNGHPSS
jgi:hypothetical protein